MAAFHSDSDDLQDDQKALLSEMREAYKSYDMDPSDTYFNLDDSTLKRYLRARSFNVSKAKAMLDATLAFRREFFSDGYLYSSGYMNTIVNENSTGKIYVRNKASDGSAIMIMRPKFENTNNHDGNLRHLVYNLERAIAAMDMDKDNRQEKITLLIDYDGYSLFNAPPFKTSRATLDILQNHYPERLLRAYCIRPPWIFTAFWNMMLPFIDPITKDKVKMVTVKTGGEVAEVLMRESGGLIQKDVLEKEFGGSCETEFKSSKYLFGLEACPEDLSESSKQVIETAKSMFGYFYSS